VRLAIPEMDTDVDHVYAIVANGHRLFDRRLRVLFENERLRVSTNVREFIFLVRYLFHLLPIVRSIFLRRLFEERQSLSNASKEISRERPTSTSKWKDRERRLGGQKRKESAIVSRLQFFFLF